jgi:uncharacterized protein (DUF3820 family)
MKVPVGKFKGQAVDSLPSQYLAWLVTRDHIRFKHWPLVKEALRVLRSRDFDGLLDELMVRRLPDHRPTPEQIVKRQGEKAEKLRALEERRERERQQRREERRVRFQQQLAESSQLIDGGEYVRQERARALQAEIARRQSQPAGDPNDVSDLL